MSEPIRLLFATHPHPRDRDALTPENTAWLAMLRDHFTTLPIGATIAIWLEQGIYGALLAHDYAGIVKLSQAFAVEHDLDEAEVLKAIANHEPDCPIIQLIEPHFRRIEAQEIQRTLLGSLDLLANIGGLEPQILELGRREEQTRKVFLRYEYPPFVAWTLWMSSSIHEHRGRSAAVEGRAHDVRVAQQAAWNCRTRRLLVRDQKFASQLSSSWRSDPTITHLMLRGSQHEDALSSDLKMRGVPFQVFRSGA